MPLSASHHESPCLHSRRRAFTLLELLLVLGILVTLSLFAGPRIGRMLARAELQMEADRLQTAMSHLRLRAIQTGRSHLFRYLPGTADYQMQTLKSDEVGTVDFEYAQQPEDTLAGGIDPLANDPEGGAGIAWGAWMGADLREDAEGAVADSTGGEIQQVQRGQLANGIVFLRPGEELLEQDSTGEVTNQLQDETEAVEIEIYLQTDMAEGPRAVSEEDWSVPIQFYPDGHAQDAQFGVLAPSGHAIRVTIVGITGRAQVGPRSRPRSHDQPDVTQTEFKSLVD